MGLSFKYMFLKRLKSFSSSLEFNLTINCKRKMYNFWMVLQKQSPHLRLSLDCTRVSSMSGWFMTKQKYKLTDGRLMTNNRKRVHPSTGTILVLNNNLFQFKRSIHVTTSVGVLSIDGSRSWNSTV